MIVQFIDDRIAWFERYKMNPDLEPIVHVMPAPAAMRFEIPVLDDSTSTQPHDLIAAEFPT